MAQQIMTKEFSICFIADGLNTKKINNLRSKLPESPYRDDAPHVTLLRGITTSSNIGSNAELVKKVGNLIKLHTALPLQLQVGRIDNISNQFYSASGVVLLNPSNALTRLRQKTIRQLTDNGYKIENQEVSEYYPHMTIRLGVPLRGAAMKHARENFPMGVAVSFDKWLLLRLHKDGKQRTVQELSPEPRV